MLCIALASVQVSAGQLRIQGHEVNVAAVGDSDTAPGSEDRSFTFSDITNWTGEGVNSAALVLQWNDERETNAIVFGYRFDGEKNGYDMARAIVEANPRLYALFCETDMGYVIGGMGWDIDSDGEIYLYESDGTLRTGENGVFESASYDFDGITAADPNDLWNSGWVSKGYWSYWVKDSQADSFSYSQLGVSNRTLHNGSWDAWNFRIIGGDTADWKPFAAAPEPEAEINFTEGGMHYRVQSHSLATVAVVAPAAGESAYSGALTVPATVSHDGKTYTVSNIDAEAFAGSNATAIDLSAIEGNLIVGNRAFAGCAALESVAFAANGASFAFGNAIFENSAALRSVSLSDEATFSRLGNNIFKGCRALTAIPAAILNQAKIAESQFEGTGVTSVALADVVELGTRAFADCANLASIDFGEKCLTVGTGAFSQSSAITELILHKINPIDVAADAFDESIFATAVLKVPYSATANYRKHAVWGKFVNIEEDAAMIVAGVMVATDDFNFCVQDINNDGNLTLAVARKAYTGDIVIPSTANINGKDYTVAAIDNFAFRACTLSSVEIPETVTRIGSNAFASTKFGSDYQLNLTSGISEIGSGAFASSNVAIVSRTLADNQPEITCVPDSLFYRCTSLWSTFIRYEKLEEIGNYSFYGCSKLTADVSEAPLKRVGNRAMTSFTISVPESLKYIGEYAFQGCTFAGNTITISPDVEYRNYCFSDIDKGSFEIEILDGVTSLPAGMFYSSLAAKNFKNDYLPEGLTSIGTQAFRSCYYFTGAVHLPSSLETLGQSSFEGIASSTVTLPEDCKFTTMPCAFNLSDIETINLPESITAIDANAFAQCKKLRRIIGGKNVTKIGARAFFICSVLENIPLNEGIETIEEDTFNSCDKLTEVSIPMSVQELRVGSFARLASLTDMVLPESLTAIRNNGWQGAFDGGNTAANVWYCLTGTSKFTTGKDVVDLGMTSSFQIIKFANYYVLHGMKAALTKLYSSYPYKEVPVSLAEVTSGHTFDESLNCIVTATPIMEQSAGEGVHIPEAFAAANRRLYGKNLSYTLQLLEELPNGASIDIDEVEVGTDGIPSVTGHINGLPWGTYHYQLVARHTDGSSVATGWQEFTLSIQTGVDEIAVSDKAIPTAYYNSCGQRSDRPFEGLNIIVYSDGHTEKQIMK